MNSLKGWLRSEALLFCLDVLKMPYNSTFFSLVFLHQETVNLSHQEICSLRMRCHYSLVHLGPKYKGRLLNWLKRVWQTDTEFQTNFQMFWYTYDLRSLTWGAPRKLTRIQRTVYSTLIKLSNLVNNVCLCYAMLNLEWVTSSVWSKQMPIPGKECGAGDPFLRILHLDFQSW